MRDDASLLSRGASVRFRPGTTQYAGLRGDSRAESAKSDPASPDAVPTRGGAQENARAGSRYDQGLTNLGALSRDELAKLQRRFEAKTTPEPMSGCVLWTGALNSQGYGNVGVAGHVRAAHRISWLLAYGSAPHGLVLDHLCRNPSCVNPRHLQPVEHAENVRRGLMVALRTRCPNGHDLTAERAKTPRNRCRACSNAAQSRWRNKAVAP